MKKVANNIIIKNVYYMMAYAFSSLRLEDYKEVEKESFDNVLNLFSAILSIGLSYQIKKGLYRDYIGKIEDLHTIRGKINMPGTINKRIARDKSITCEFDEYSDNHLFNQILKSTVYLLIRQKHVDEKYKERMKKEMLFFSNVDMIDLHSIPWSSIHFQRSNESYKMLLGVCRMIIEGMLMTTSDGSVELKSIIDDQLMSRLYEKFILEYYRREWPKLRASDSSIFWAVDDGLDEMLPQMHTDIMLTYKNRVLILDAKYYSKPITEIHNKKTLVSENLYQMFAYVKNKEMEKGKKWDSVSGILLYAKTTGDLHPDNLYRLSGNVIGAKTLDLNLEFSEIRKQLDFIGNAFEKGEL